MAGELVELGKDGWMFLSGGSNPFLSYLRRAECLTPDTLRGWRQLLLSRRDRANNRGIRYMHTFAPDKATIYHDKLLSPVDVELSHIASISHVAGDLFLDLREYFNKQKNKFDLYHKTDSHWNFYGAFSAFQMIMAVLKYSAEDSIIKAAPSTINVAWDLGAKFNPVITEQCEIRNILSKASRVWVNDLVRAKERLDKPNEGRLHVGSVAIFKNDSAVNCERLIIFGDSFSEYRPNLLTAMLAESFAEVHFVWSSAVSFDYIDLVRPDVVLSVTAERFARLVPSDDVSINAVVERQLSDFFGDARPEQIVAIPSANDLDIIRSA